MGDNTLLKDVAKAAVTIEKSAANTLMDSTSPDRLENYEPDELGHKALAVVENKVINIKEHQIKNLKQDRALLKDELKAEKKDFKELKKEISKREKLDNKRADKKLKSDKEKLRDDIKKGNLSEKTIDERKVRIKYDNKDRRIRQQNNDFYKIKKSEKKDIKKEIKSTKKDIRKNNFKALRKQAAVTSIKANRELMNDFKSGSGLSSDNLIESGNKSLVGAVNRLLNRLFNPIEKLKNYIKAKIAALFAMLLTQLNIMLLPILVTIVLPAVIVVGVLGAASGVASDIMSFFGLGGQQRTDDNTRVEAYTEQEIEDIIAQRDGLTDDQKALMRFALSKVGCVYSNSGRHNNGPTYDCSSLAYYTEASIGKDVGHDYYNGYLHPSTAGYQANKLNQEGKIITDTSVEPQVGDLLFYREENPKWEEKWNYIYHVAIYVGNDYVVDASSGRGHVVYRPVTTENLFWIGRP